MKRPSDYQLREQALDTRRSFVVTAPAGSGKTSLLVMRYLKLLAYVSQPEHIIAITFTRKAANEMKDRIFKALDSASRNANEVTNSQLQDLARQAFKKDQENNWQLLSHPARLNIRTIDSLAYHIVKQMPWSSGFGATPSIVSDDAKQLYKQAGEQAILYALNEENYRLKITNLLLAVDNKLAKLSDLIASLLSQRDQWQDMLELQTFDGESRQRLQSSWRQIIETILKQISDLLSDEVKSNLLVCAQYAGNNISKIDPASAIAQLATLDKFPCTDHNELPLWQGLCSLLLTTDGKRFRSPSANSLTRTIGFPSVKQGGDNSKKELMGEVLDSVSTSKLQELFTLVHTMPQASYDESQWQFLQDLLAILKLSIAQLLVTFQKRGYCDHIEIANRANLAMSGEHAHSDLNLRLDHKISHLLVDEFQDTSHSQWKLINQLIAGWEYNDGRTLFIVGDAMQSIYRFRQADVSILQNIAKYGLPHIQLHALAIQENFRSAESIVDWVNDTFSQVFNAQQASHNVGIGYHRSKAYQLRHGDDGVMIYKTDKENEARQVIELINQCSLNDHVCGDIAILVRSRRHLNEIIVKLNQGDIDYQGVKIDKLTNLSCIQDAIALTKALTHLGDKLSWLSLLRSPFCGLQLKDLTLIANLEENQTVLQRLIELPSELTDCGKQRCQQFVNIISPILAKISHYPLHKLIAQAWFELGGVDTVTTADNKNVSLYLQLLANSEQSSRLVELSKLELQLENLWASTEHADTSLKLMTIHNAKGLEFDAVILPGLYKKPQANKEQLLIWTQFSHADLSSSLLISPMKTDANPSKRYNFIKFIEQLSDKDEIKRLLYVGCTRAKKQLHLFVSDKPHPSSLQSMLPQSIQANASEVNDIPQDDVETKKIELNYQRLPITYQYKPPIASLTDNTLQEKFNDEIEFRWASIRARQLGSLLHEVILTIASNHQTLTTNIYNYWQSRLLALGVESSSLDSTMKTIEALFDIMQNDKIAKWILSSQQETAKNEWALAFQLDEELENIVIDRTFIDNNDIRWIIDYKMSTHKGGDVDNFLDNEQLRYRQQLEHYAKLIRLNETRSIRLGLYFPLLSGWREWAFAG